MQRFSRRRWTQFEALSRGAPADPSWAKRIAMVAFTTALVTLVGCGSAAVRDASVESKDKGFFGWHFHAPFDTSEVKTVAVFIKSQSFRRDLQLQLTEAVIKEINLRTPYRVVGDHEKADSILTGVINQEGKNLVVEAPTNFARELNGTISVQMKWMRNPPSEAELAQLPTLVTETINWVPEVGETVLSAYNHINQSLAKQIVDMMEQPLVRPERRGIAIGGQYRPARRHSRPCRQRDAHHAMGSSWADDRGSAPSGAQGDGRGQSHARQLLRRRPRVRAPGWRSPRSLAG